MKHSDWCTHINNPEDRDILTRKLFDVNMRLFRANDSYRALVQKVCEFIEYSTMTEKEGYKKPHGYSGANAGIPWNIIGIAHAHGDATVMINPMYTPVEKEGKRVVKSNCGSLTLPEPIEITRWNRINVSYYDVFGEYNRLENVGPSPGFTIQHEVEHNLGILITDQK